MHIGRVFRSSVVLAGLGCFGLALLPGCEDGQQSGDVVKVDPQETADRAKKIQNMYKSSPPRATSATGGPPGSGGPVAPVAPPTKD
jgi:hypothetical protein